MLKRNYLLEKLKNTNEVCIGTWSIIPSPIFTDILCSAGLDFIVVDSEHGPIGYERAQEIAIACESQEVSPIMRIAGVDQESVLKALEIGMHGIQVPNIESIKQINTLQEYSKYPPHGRRGFSPFTRACGYTSDYSSEMISRANANTLLNIHIEGSLGVNNIDGILKNTHIDVCFLGLFDISNYLGRAGEIDHPEVISLFKDLSLKIISAGKIVGSISNSIEQLNFLIDNGVRYITHSVDCHIVRKEYKHIASIAKIRR
jgi:4-hydroxy-2-oxoheptanedioate aldolase